MALDDQRGFQAITGILTDRSDRPPGFTPGGNWSLQAQIRSDRYYAVHLLGELRDPRAVPILAALLPDKDVTYKVPWALSQIGGPAIGVLLNALDDRSGSVVVAAIEGLERLNARDALPRLRLLVNDARTANSGGRVTVGAEAKAAIAKLQ